MADPKTRIIISAVDQTKAAFGSAKRNLSDLAKEGQSLAGKFGGIGRSLAGLTGIGGIGTLLTGGGLIAATKQVSDAAVQVDRLAKISGASAEEFQRYAAGAREVGFQADKMADVFKDVNDKVGDFLNTGGGPLKDFFEQIGPKVGVTAEQFRNLSGPQALQLYFDSLEKANVSQADMTFYLEAIANDATALAPLLASNGQRFRELGDEAERLGGIMSDDLIRASVEFENNLTRMQTVFSGLQAQIGNEVIPVLNELAEEFLDARRAGLSFMESLVGIGLSDPTKTASEHVARLTQEINELREAQSKPWYARSLIQNIGGEDRIAQLEKELAYWKLREKSAFDDAFVGPTAPTSSPRTGTFRATPAAKKGSTKKEDLNAGFDISAAQAYARAVEQIRGAQIGAETSGLDLNAAQQTLYELMRSPEWDRMPEPWRQVAIAQAAAATETINNAAEQKKFNDLIAATPTEKLKEQRKTMQLLADAFLAGTINAQQFEEATTVALGNVAEKTTETTDIMEEFTKQAARNMQDAFADVLFDPFAQGLDGMLVGFGKMLQRMIAEAVAADLANRIMGPKGDGKGGWIDLAFTAASAYFGGGFGSTSTAPANISRGGGFSTSFDGGGYTGNGPRTGGLDGKGGFMALVHPRETIIDHAKGQSLGGQSINITVNVPAGTPAETRRAAAAGARSALGALDGARRYA